MVFWWKLLYFYLKHILILSITLYCCSFCSQLPLKICSFHKENKESLTIIKSKCALRSQQHSRCKQPQTLCNDDHGSCPACCHRALWNSHSGLGYWFNSLWDIHKSNIHWAPGVPSLTTYLHSSCVLESS